MIVPAAAAEERALLGVAELMVAAARTAPKGRGKDLLRALILTGDDRDRLAAGMERFGRERGQPTFSRDAAGVRAAGAVVLLGTRHEPLGLAVCGYCGWRDCAECAARQGRCAFPLGDLGIAVGSAAAVAADHRIDNRVMYSAGWTAMAMQLLGEGVVVAYGIPLSVSGKNPFFDRG